MPLHGKYTGPQRVPGKGPGVDNVDELSRAHDAFYDKAGNIAYFLHSTADDVFLDGLRAIEYDKNWGIRKKIAFLGGKFWFSLKKALAPNIKQSKNLGYVVGSLLPFSKYLTGYNLAKEMGLSFLPDNLRKYRRWTKETPAGKRTNFKAGLDNPTLAGKLLDKFPRTKRRKSVQEEEKKDDAMEVVREDSSSNDSSSDSSFILQKQKRKKVRVRVFNLNKKNGGRPMLTKNEHRTIIIK